MKKLFWKTIQSSLRKMKNIKIILIGVLVCVFIFLSILLLVPKTQDVWVAGKIIMPPVQNVWVVEKVTMPIQVVPTKNEVTKDQSEDIREETVRGTSMLPLITDGQTIRYSHGYYRDHQVERSDIVIADVAAHSGLIIKRVVWIPGDSWSYSGGIITLNGNILKNTAGEVYNIQSKMLTLYSDSYPIIPRDTFLILGDQISGTLDASKFWLISLSELVGKVIEY